MQLRQLEYFAEVAGTLSFTTAAARLHVVQSGVSAAIRTLERELGAELFERTAQGLRLTDAGRLLLPEARATLQAARRAEEAVAHARAGLRGEIRIGVLASVDIVDVPALIGAFHRAHPGVRLRVRSGATSGFLDALAAHDLDLALVSPPAGVPEGIGLRLLGSTPFVAMLPGDHPLAQRAEIAIGELADEAFIDAPTGFGNRDQLDALFATHGLARAVGMEVPDVATIAEYVRNGLGVALAPRLTAFDGRGVTVVPLAAPAPTWSLYLAFRTEARPGLAVQALVDAFLRRADAPEGGSPPRAAAG